MAEEYVIFLVFLNSCMRYFEFFMRCERFSCSFSCMFYPPVCCLVRHFFRELCMPVDWGALHRPWEYCWPNCTIIEFTDMSPPLCMLWCSFWRVCCLSCLKSFKEVFNYLNGKLADLNQSGFQSVEETEKRSGNRAFSHFQFVTFVLSPRVWFSGYVCIWGGSHFLLSACLLLTLDVFRKVLAMDLRACLLVRGLSFSFSFLAFSVMFLWLLLCFWSFWPAFPFRTFAWLF